MDCFLLTRQWRDGRDGLELVFWAASAEGPVRVVVTGEEAVCFVNRDNDLDLTSLGDAGFRRRPLELQTLDGRRRRWTVFSFAA